MLVLLTATALAASTPCVATSSGPGLYVTIEATMANNAVVRAKQQLSIDVAAIDQGESAYEYNGNLNVPHPAMARVVITEIAAPGKPSSGTIELLAPEVYSPAEAMLAGISGEELVPLQAGLRVVAAGTPIAWYPAGLYDSPMDLPSSNIKVYRVVFGDLSDPPDPTRLESANRILAALQSTGSIRVETVVGKTVESGERLPVPRTDDPAASEVAGTFELSAAAIAPATSALGVLQAQVGRDYQAGRCGEQAPSQTESR